MYPKHLKREISGVLLLDKPARISSNQALQIAKRLFAAAKAGHTGTLDPMATGLLPVCFGEATKFSAVLLGADKTYDATLKLGYISTTGDAEGEISVALDKEPEDSRLTLPHVEMVLQSFTGAIMQRPPMFSAIKHRGKPMYRYAREGVVIERQPRKVFIRNLQVQAITHDEMRIVVTCGTGTYVRTLAEDIGRALGWGGAYLTALRRTVLDDFNLTHAYALDVIEAMPAVRREHCLLSADSLVQKLPAATLDAAAAVSLLQGRTIGNFISAHGLTEGGKIRLYDQQECFLGLGEITARGEIAPKRLMNFCAERPAGN
ncbi:MAG TPA: tRNA pseudouridine(55) synthase TruB [Nitrosospira sp.]